MKIGLVERFLDEGVDEGKDEEKEDEVRMFFFFLFYSEYKRKGCHCWAMLLR